MGKMYGKIVPTVDTSHKRQLRESFWRRRKKMRQPRIAKDLPAHVRKPQPWLRDKNHLGFVRTLPCLACGRRGPCEAAHVRLRTDGAMGRKPSDNYTVPLCGPTVDYAGCHKTQHFWGEPSFWTMLMEIGGITDPWTVANRLWTISGDTELGYRAIQHARPGLPTAGMT
jgi:hypothetical protein